MPDYEECDFDTNLFGFKVARIDLEKEDLMEDWALVLRHNLRRAERKGIKLLYLLSPKFEPSQQEELECLQACFPGILVDWKTLLSSPLEKWDEDELLERGQGNEEIEIINWDRSDCPDTLMRLSLDSGIYSRFKVDRLIPSEVFAGVFGGWIKNSVNRTMADEVFVAVDKRSKEEVGLITVKRKGQALVDIGLLAVSSSHRRKGIARSLVYRSILWSKANLSGVPNAKIQVVTQGANETACKTYEKCGFTIETTQIVHHVWLPQHLGGSQYEAAAAKLDNLGIPFCKQYLTGQELPCIKEIFDAGLLNSTSKFTSRCALKLWRVLNGEDLMPWNPNSPKNSENKPTSEEWGGKHGECDEVLVTASGTAALEMAALLCEVGPGDEVIMPSYTFSSTANAFVLRGAVPVFVDIRPDTLNIDESLVEAAVTQHTKVICVVHYGGVACEMDTICDIALRHGLMVVEDAAQAYLSTYKGRKLGTIGDFGCFSFHYTKNVICGEGGALAINRSADRARRAINIWEKGTNRCDFLSKSVDKYQWVDIGSSNVPSEISCAILWAQLLEAENITSQRQRNYAIYEDGLKCLVDTKKARIPIIPAGCVSNAHIFFLVFPSRESRELVQRRLQEKDISVFSHYVPLHSSPAGIKYGRLVRGVEALTVTVTASEGLLRLPMWAGLSVEDIQKVISAVIEASEDL